MKAFVVVLLLLSATTSGFSQTAGSRGTIRAPKNSFEAVLVYVETTTSSTGVPSYIFKDEKGEVFEFVDIDHKNSNLKMFFENGDIKSAKDKGDYTVKGSVGKKFRINYQLEKGQENLAWAAKTIVKAIEMTETKK